VVYKFVQMVIKQKFGFCADKKGEKALHTLQHVMLKYCGCGLFHFCRRFGTLLLQKNEIQSEVLKLFSRKWSFCGV